MPRLSPWSTRTLTVLVVGMLTGGAAALLAGSILATQVAEEALAIDRTAALAEAATTLHASLNQAALVIAAAPDHQDRAVRLALDQVSSSQRSLDRLVESLEPSGAALINAVEGYAAAASDLAEQLAGDRAEAPDAQVASLAYRTLRDVVYEQQRASRAAVTAMADSRGVATVATATIVLLLFPALSVVLVVRAIRPLASPEPSERAIPGVPSRLAAALEERAASVTEHARGMTWIRPDDREAAAYRSLLTEASRMSVTARNLLALERIDRRELVVTAEPTDLAPIAGRIRSITADLAWEVDVVLEEVVVLADPVRVQQVVENLLSVLVGCGAHRIALVLGRNGTTGSISVAGDDCSLPRESLRMVQGLPGTPQRAAGIALAASRSLLDAMSGNLRHSELDGTTMFTVELPLARVG